MADQIPKSAPDERSARISEGVSSSRVPAKTVDPKVSTEKVDEKAHSIVRGPIPFRFRDQILFGSVCAIAMTFMAVYCVRMSLWRGDPIELERQPQHELDYKIDLNSATWVEWSQLPGIGSVLANRIVEERQQNGPFRNIDDLNRVRGIGRKRIEAIRPFVRTGLQEDRPGLVDDVPTQVGSAKSP